jgi:hypothetical protein
LFVLCVSQLGRTLYEYSAQPIGNAREGTVHVVL